MIYNGQEVGEPGLGVEGFGGDDGRSSIFDYWGMPKHQLWMNNGAFDGGKLSADDQKLRDFYAKLIYLVKNHDAIKSGDFYELLAANQSSEGFNEKVYAYLRYTSNKQLLVLTNFNRKEVKLKVQLPNDVLSAFNLNEKAVSFTDLLTGTIFKTQNINDGLSITMPATSAVILEF